MAESTVRTEVSAPAAGNILSGGVIVNNSSVATYTGSATATGILY